MDRTPFAHVLHAEVVEKLADGRVFQRGTRYFQESRVERLVQRGTRLTAGVRGSSAYDVELWVRGERIGYACTCPAGESGDFCKHCVAVALAWLATSTLPS